VSLLEFSCSKGSARWIRREFAPGLRFRSRPCCPGSRWGLLGQDWFRGYGSFAPRKPRNCDFPVGVACSYPAVEEDARSRLRLEFVLITLPHVLARAIASFMPFPVLPGHVRGPPTGGRLGLLLLASRSRFTGASTGKLLPVRT
jgi:hypothetical protein